MNEDIITADFIREELEIFLELLVEKIDFLSVTDYIGRYEYGTVKIRVESILNGDDTK